MKIPCILVVWAHDEKWIIFQIRNNDNESLDERNIWKIFQENTIRISGMCDALYCHNMDEVF